MTTGTSSTGVRRILGLTAAVLLVVSAVAFTVRQPLYESLADAAFDNPGLHGIVDVIAGKGLLALLAITALITVIAWRRGAETFVLLVSAGVGTITAYATSEAVKLLIEQERPCHEITLDTIMACPAAGDWSWPSNHATIAAALATSCILIIPRIWPLIAPIALLIALSRVLAGVHYPHDVATGLALGIAFTLLVTLIVNRPLARILTAMRRSMPGKRHLTHR